MFVWGSELSVLFMTQRGLIGDHTPSVDLFDLDYLDSRVDSVLEAFPEEFFLHAAAMKANSICGVMLVRKG